MLVEICSRRRRALLLQRARVGRGAGHGLRALPGGRGLRSLGHRGHHVRGHHHVARRQPFISYVFKRFWMGNGPFLKGKRMGTARCSSVFPWLLEGR